MIGILTLKGSNVYSPMGKITFDPVGVACNGKSKCYKYWTPSGSGVMGTEEFSTIFDIFDVRQGLINEHVFPDLYSSGVCGQIQGRTHS